MSTKNPYRTHTCGELRINHVGQQVRLAGWIHRKRDHGGVLFIDLRDHYGIIQLVTRTDQEELSRLNLESVLCVVGNVRARQAGADNKELQTGEVEVVIEHFSVESSCQALPFSVNQQEEVNEELRLRYRFLDLRRAQMQRNTLLRSNVIRSLREIMHQNGFVEFQTPVLTASSPEGARDFLVPSRLHKGKFYALPQAPQQFKQLLMVSGFDKYFQIAPCFRDEDARAERSPGEFYQLDIEMSFVTQEEIFLLLEKILREIFTRFSDFKLSNAPFARIPYDVAMLEYGSDKPDLRNPLKVCDLTSFFARCEIFAKKVAKGHQVRCISLPAGVPVTRRLCDEALNTVLKEGAEGLAYLKFETPAKGPIAKFLTEAEVNSIQSELCAAEGSAAFFLCDEKSKLPNLCAKLRSYFGEALNLIEQNCYKFCWVTDFPFYELDSITGEITFSHNPFSMPKGGLDTLKNAKTIQDYLNIRAYQYDIVCNGVELSSGAIRNHKIDLLYEAFRVVGYSKEEVEQKFGGLVQAMKFGAPPHGGIAPGIDRIIMLLAGAKNIREVIAFPLNQQAEDLLMGAPSRVKQQQLQELGIALANKSQT